MHFFYLQCKFTFLFSFISVILVIQNRAVYFRKKWTEEKPNIYFTTAGLELADLTISPLRRIMHPEFLLIQKKLYNYPNYMNNGLNIIT